MRYAWLVTLDRGLAEDVVQEAFVRLGMRSNWTRRIENPPAYLRRMVTNLARNQLRSLVRRRRREEDAALEATTATDPEDPEIVRRAALERGLATLSTRQRAVVVMHYYEDRTVDSIALILGVTPGTVKTQLHRARRRLRDHLEEKGDLR